MTRITSVFLSVIVIMIVASGCSSGNSNPVSTQNKSDINSPLILPETNADNSNRTPLGMWTLHFDPECLTTSLEPNRELNRHYSVLSSIEPPVITVTYWDTATETVHVNITIKNSSFLNVFDVRLIIFTDDAGHTLSNADGMTGLWDIPDGLPFNPFMAYAKTVTRRNFQTQAEYTENLQIYCPDENFNIQFAIDASFPGNCEEPYAFENFTQGVLYDTPGSQASITVDVFDWQDDVNEVYLHCPSITGPALLPFENAGGNTWQLEFVNETGVSQGEYKAWLLAKSTNSGSLALYDEIKITISIYIPTGWAVQWGGDTTPVALEDAGCGVTSDRNGNAIVTGYFQSPCDFDPGPNEDIHLATGVRDIYLSKFKPDGSFLWARTWGGVGDKYVYERGEDVITDSDGNIYVVGSYYMSADFDPGPDEDIHTSNGNEDIFLCKYDKDGNFIWAQTWGGVSSKDRGSDVTIDSEGYICVTGIFKETVDFDPGTGVEERTAPLNELHTYLSRFASDGLFMWVQTWNAACYTLTADNYGNIYIAGSFLGEVDFDPGPYVNSRQSCSERDYCISKFDINGNYKGVITGYSGSSVTSACVTTDADGDIYLIGNISRQVNRYTWCYSLYIKKFNSAGSVLWETFAETDYNKCINGYSIDVDDLGNIYTIGRFQGGALFNPGVWRTSNGCIDIFIAKYNAQGDIIWLNNYGESYCQGKGLSLSVSPDECIYATGMFNNTLDFDPGSGVDEHTALGEYDSFLTKILPTGYWE